MDSCPFWSPVRARYRRYLSGYCTAGPEPLSIPTIEEMREWCGPGDFRACPTYRRARPLDPSLGRSSSRPPTIPPLDPHDVGSPAGEAAR